MINILIVEDETDFSDAIEKVITSFVNDVQIHVAKNRNDALNFLDQEFYDLIILDLRIPLVDGEATDVAYGILVLTQARVNASGTPIIVVTESSTEEHLPQIISHSEKQDVWGEGQALQMITFHKKRYLDKFPQLIEPYLTNLQKVHNIELVKRTKLSIAEDRLIRIFTRKRGCSKCEVSVLKGGFSGTTVYRLKITDPHGEGQLNIVCKIGSIESIKLENNNYENHIQRLHQKATPRKIAILEHGAKNICAIFYSLADGYESNIFDYVTKNLEPASNLIRSLEELTNPWISNSEARKTIKEVRERVLWQADFEKIRGEVKLEWIEAFEKVEIQTKWSCVHGDMHGLNVLISATNTPLLIDYGDVGHGAACLDPITVELSLSFHPEGSFIGNTWPTDEQAISWGDLDKYLVGCPFPEFIRECRLWANRSAAGQREIAAMAYAYVLRQWKYPNVNKSRVIALLNGIKIFYDENT